MPRIVKSGLVQTRFELDGTASLEAIYDAQLKKALGFVEQAAKQGVQILCFQELFNGPYFCAEQTTKWYDFTEPVPDGRTTQLFMGLAKKHGMVIVLPIYEREMDGVYYNTAAVIDADGTYLGKYRKNHIPQVAPGFWEKFYFKPGNLGYPTFQTKFAQDRRLHLLRPPLPRGRAHARPARRRDRLQPVGDGRPGSPNTCGSSSSPRTPSRTATSSARSTASASRSRGRSASSTGRAISATRAARCSPSARATRTSWSSPSSTST